MSIAGFPKYVPGSRWKALIVSNGPDVHHLHMWAVDVESGSPFHADALEAMGLDDVDRAFAYIDTNAQGTVACLLQLDPSLDRTDVEGMLRARVPGLEIEPEGWNFG